MLTVISLFTLADAQYALSKLPKVMNRLVDLIQSPDISVCRNAAYTLSVAAQNGIIQKV